MLRIIVEVVPGGDPDLAYVIAEAEVTNISEFLGETAEYQYVLKEKTSRGFDGQWRVKRGKVRGHKRDNGAWSLIHRILKKTHPCPPPKE